MSATVLPPEPAAPSTIHSCPGCSHWLAEGTLACPDCHALTYAQHLEQLAAEAQQLEAQKRLPEALDRWRSALKWLPEDTRQSLNIRQRVVAIEGKLRAEEDRNARWTKRLGPLAPVALFLFKLKSALFFVFKLKFLLSLFFYFGIYWAMFGWWFALGFTAAILIHEMGHYIAAKRRGLQVDLPLFIPGFGAYVRWYGMGVSREDLAAISLAGPLFGLAAAAGFWALYYGTHHPLFLVLANLTSWFNILNLIPVFGLDGAKAVLALSRLQRGLIAITCVIFFILASGRDPMALGDVSNHYIFLVLAACMAWQIARDTTPEEPHTSTLVYFLSVLLVLGLILHMTGAQLMQVPDIGTRIRIH